MADYNLTNPEPLLNDDWPPMECMLDIQGPKLEHKVDEEVVKPAVQETYLAEMQKWRENRVQSFSSASDRRLAGKACLQFPVLD